MININISKYLILTIAIVLSSCSSFEQQRQFAYKILDNPDSAVTIYKNSEFYDSLVAPSLIKEDFDDMYLTHIKQNYWGHNYKILEANEMTKNYTKNDSSFAITWYHLTIQSNMAESYAKFSFKLIGNKWILVSMSAGENLEPYL